MLILFKKRPEWFYSLSTGIFIYFFLKIFKPFGFSQIPPQILEPLFLGYSLIGFGLVLLNHLLLGRYVSRRFPDQGSPARVAIWPLWITLTITLANILFTGWYFVETGLRAPGQFKPWSVIIGTLALGTLCIVLIELVDQNLRLKQNLRTVADANAKLKSRLQLEKTAGDDDIWVELEAQNEKDVFRFTLKSLVFLSAEENYVAVHYLEENLKRTLIRCTLTGIEEQVARFYPTLFRCHRRYIVNIQKINSVSGNAQGFRLSLVDSPEIVPVSRRYVGDFRKIVAEAF